MAAIWQKGWQRDDLTEPWWMSFPLERPQCARLCCLGVHGHLYVLAHWGQHFPHGMAGDMAANLGMPSSSLSQLGAAMPALDLIATAVLSFLNKSKIVTFSLGGRHFTACPWRVKITTFTIFVLWSHCWVSDSYWLD